MLNALRASLSLFLLLVFLPSASLALSVDEINNASFDSQVVEGRNPLVMRLQVLLDRAHFSPGVIDGLTGGNTDKALEAYAGEHDLDAGGGLREEIWTRLVENDDAPAFKTYTIKQEDLDEDFVDSIPEGYDEQAAMERLSYTSPEEMFAEQFHMDIDLLRELNPNADFASPGTEIIVADVADHRASGEVTRIVVSRGESFLRGYDSDGNLVVFYTATVGSEQTPSPEGSHTVEAVVLMPNYTYRPEVNFQQGDIDENLILPPGPNNPVGSVWIDLSEPTYGIHGTPEPSQVDKTYSHGCVRLTNWDAEELAELVEEGAVVEFVD
jgi:lipoprotein-anchoring transpeptidase ErfK/SrfK